MTSLVTDDNNNTTTTSTTTTTTNQNDMESYDNKNNNVNTINIINTMMNNHLSDLTQKAKKQAIERIVAMANFELTKLDKKVVSEPQHFEDLPNILQICSGTDEKPGLISYFEDDIVAVINMFGKSSKQFLEYDPLRHKYYKIVLQSKYGGVALGKSVTYLSALHGKIDVVNYLLEKGGDWNDKIEGLVNRLEDYYEVNFSSDAIDLEDKNITDEDVQIIGELLKTNNTIKKLDLHDNNITDVQSIGEGLKTNNTLTRLDLDNNNITDDSGIQSIIDVLKTNNTLKTLYLRNNQLSDNMKSQLKAIQQYKRDGSNGYQQVKGMEIYT